MTEATPAYHTQDDDGQALPASPDEALIRAANEALEIVRKIDALCDPVNDLPGDDPRIEIAYAAARDLADPYHEAVAVVASLPARTAAGLRAKARVAACYLEYGDNNGLIGASLARDILEAAA